MTNSLETYLHQIGLVAELLLPSSQGSDESIATEVTASSSRQIQQQIQQQQQWHPSSLSSMREMYPPPSVAKFSSASDGFFIYTNPVIEASSTEASSVSNSHLGPIYVASTVTNYPPAGEPTYVHSIKPTSAWLNATESSNNCTFLVGDSVVNRQPNAVTTVKVSSSPHNDQSTKSSHQNHNITQVSHVANSALSSPVNTTRQSTVVQCSTNSYSLNHNRPQVTSETYSYPTTSYQVTQSAVHADPTHLATRQASSSSLNPRDISQGIINTNDNRSCLVDVDRLPNDSPGVTGSNLSRDNNSNNSLVFSIRQNLSDILHLNQTPFDQSPLHLNHSNQPTIFNQFVDHCSDISPNTIRHFPAEDDSKRNAEHRDVILSPSTLPTAHSSWQSSNQSSNIAFQPQPTMIKSSLKKEAPPPNGARKAVTFCTSDLVHVEEYTISPSSPPHDLFLPLDGQLENISDDVDSVLFDVDSAELWPPLPGTQENCSGKGLWFNSSTDAEPYLVDFPSQSDDSSRDCCAPLSFANDVFGRTTIVLTSGTFRPGESGKLNGKTMGDLSGGGALHDHRRTLSAGTVSGIRSHRTLVKVNFIQGLLDINHNPGQTAEVDSKAVLDHYGSGSVSTLDYCRGIFHEDLKNSSMKTSFPNESISVKKRINEKICHKLSIYKHKLIVVIVGVFILLSVAIGLGVGLSH